MSLSSYKITDAAIAESGVTAAPDKLTGTAAQNKAVFDRLIREAVKSLYNGLIDALASENGAGEIGAAAIEGVTGGDVQTALGSLKAILDTKSASADVTAALALKSDKSVTDLHVKSVACDAQTSALTFTKEDGSTQTVTPCPRRLFVHSFTAGDWTSVPDGKAMTVSAAAHGITGSAVLAQFRHLTGGSCVSGTCACLESRAEIDASTHAITLRAADAYAGEVVLYG